MLQILTRPKSNSETLIRALKEPYLILSNQRYFRESKDLSYISVILSLKLQITTFINISLPWRKTSAKLELQLLIMRIYQILDQNLIAKDIHFMGTEVI